MTWSLYKRASSDDNNIFDTAGELLEPLVFSNGKTQEDVSNEILKEIKNGHNIIFVKGVCGTGKSAIALNLAKEYKKTSIVVPIKSLQEQYEKDYTKDKFILKNDGKPLKISMIKGRGNFSCKYKGGLADQRDLPCSIEIREKNVEQLMNYIRENPNLSEEDFATISDIKRMNIAPICPYWSPLLPADMKPKGLDDVQKLKFETSSGKEFALFQRKKGCGYFDQYENYVSSDVLIFNAAKYLIEIEIGRKPKTEIDIIDECDEFLDNFANEKRINIQRFMTAMSSLMPEKKEKRLALKELIYEANTLLYDKSQEVDCEKLKETKFLNIIKKVLDNPNLAEDEELNYYNRVVEIARSFETVLDETYVTIEKFTKETNQEQLFSKKPQQEENVFVTLVTINLAKKMQELTSQGNILILMSGTLHSEEVLRDIYGLKKFKVIEAETILPGKINLYRTGVERACNYANFKNGIITRPRYLKMLDCALANCNGQTLVHVNSFSDLPTQREFDELKFDNLISQDDLKTIQLQSNKSIEDFTTKRKKILFTTKCNRGVDFAGNKCENIVLTKYPYPNIQGLFWKILRKEQPEKFREFYIDKANREFIQKIARGIRFKGDSVNVLSPDARVINSKII